MCLSFIYSYQEQIHGTCLCHALGPRQTMFGMSPGCFLLFTDSPESNHLTMSVSTETKVHKSDSLHSAFVAVGDWKQRPQLFHTPHNAGNIKSISLLLESYQAHGRHLPTEGWGCRSWSWTWVSTGHAMTSFPFLEGKAWASPVRMKALVELEKKQGLVKTSQAELIVAEQLNTFTDHQPDKSPHTITGLQEIRHVCISIRFFVISLAAKANQSKLLVTRKTIA